MDKLLVNFDHAKDGNKDKHLTIASTAFSVFLLGAVITP
jgi:hypothetical protein